MKLVRPRITLRWLMIAVMAAGLALGGITLKHRSDRYRDKAKACATVASVWRALVRTPETSRERRLRVVAHYVALRDKYERAARCPWLPVEPDSPEPE